MTPYTFEKPRTLADALAARRADSSFLLAGGTDLIAQMKSGHRAPAHVVDVKGVPEMSNIAVRDDGRLEIGAAVSATVLAGRRDIAERHTALHDAVQLIGSLQIQNRATLGGNICNAAPSADAVPALIADGARARIAGAGGDREIALEDVFEGPGRTSIGADELLVSIILPAPQHDGVRTGSAYLRFTPRREMDIAVVGAAARICVDEARRTITSARISLASVAPTPIRAPSAEATLTGEMLSTDVFEKAAEAARGDASPISDTRASADYRRELVGVLVRRALSISAGRLGLPVDR